MKKIQKIYKDVIVTNSDLGEGVSVGDDSVVVDSKIGNYVEIDRRNYIHNSCLGTATYTGMNTYIGMADVGNYCSISRSVDIGGAEHDYDAISMFPDEKMLGKIMDVSFHLRRDVRVKIGNDCWVGQGVTILKKKGLSIGNGVVIGAGSIVTKDIPDYAVVVGVPAKVVKYRFSESAIKELNEIKWWDWPIESIYQHWTLFHETMTLENLNELWRIKEKIDVN